MTTDFLDRLETDLHAAAERRGQPSPRRRRPRPGAALKVLAVAAVLALLVVGGARLAGRDDIERPARPTPTPTPDAITGSPTKTIVATGGDPSSLDVFVQRLTETPQLEFIAPENGRPALADPSLGTAVFFRGDAAKDAAALVSRTAGIAMVRALTAVDERKLGFKVGDADLVIVFGTDLQERMLQRSDDCTPAGTVTGGELSVCLTTRQGRTLSGFLVDGKRLPVGQMTERGQWRWAAASPDGETIFAQWSGECEVPQTFFIDAEGGRPRPITAGPSEAFGWTTDGRAIVSRPANPACGDGGDPGLYVVTPDREPTLLGKAVPRGLEPSIEPRAIGEVTGAAP